MGTKGNALLFPKFLYDFTSSKEGLFWLKKFYSFQANFNSKVNKPKLNYSLPCVYGLPVCVFDMWYLAARDLRLLTDSV